MSTSSPASVANPRGLRLLGQVAVFASVALAVYFGLSWFNQPVAAVWTDDYAAAVKQAQAENKKILLNFTGSDWCVNCTHLDDDVFSKPAFARYARSHYVLVTVDFPLQKKLPDNVAQQNQALQEKYAVPGYPTLVLLDSSEHKLNQIVGYNGSRLQAYLSHLDKDFAGSAP